VELLPVTHADIDELRALKLDSYHVPLLANFHAHLAGHADAFALTEGASTVGYALLLVDHHEGHDHVTLIELYLTPPFADCYEDAVELIQAEKEPRAYLARSDDCAVATALIALGFRMDTSMSIMVARAALPPAADDALALVPLDYPYLRAAYDLYEHTRGVEQPTTMEELESAIEDENVWVLTRREQPLGLLVQETSQSRRFELVDIMAPHVSDGDQLWGLLTLGTQLEAQGLTAAAVVDPRDLGKQHVFRRAGYYTAGTYLVFSDPAAGRANGPQISRDELWAALQAGETLVVLDALGEEHWRRGHLSGAQWLDYRHLSKDAKRTIADKDQPVVVYCSDYT
jgi:hypothetical protein